MVHVVFVLVGSMCVAVVECVFVCVFGSVRKAWVVCLGVNEPR